MCGNPIRMMSEPYMYTHTHTVYKHSNYLIVPWTFDIKKYSLSLFYAMPVSLKYFEVSHSRTASIFLVKIDT